MSNVLFKINVERKREMQKLLEVLDYFINGQLEVEPEHFMYEEQSVLALVDKLTDGGILTSEEKVLLMRVVVDALLLSDLTADEKAEVYATAKAVEVCTDTKRVIVFNDVELKILEDILIETVQAGILSEDSQSLLDKIQRYFGKCEE